jgi:hypothetical protein
MAKNLVLEILCSSLQFLVRECTEMIWALFGTAETC